MAKLIIKSKGIATAVLELRPGSNSVGRSERCNFQLLHPTVSNTHCELILSDAALTLRDCGSKNGTRLDGDVVEEVPLRVGHVIHLGEVELVVVSTKLAVNKILYDRSRGKPLVVLEDGYMICPTHNDARATYCCANCGEVMCPACIHRLARRGGLPHLLCPSCSKEVELIDQSRSVPPVMSPDGATICPRHASTTARFRCTNCRELMCQACALKRRRARKIFLYCPLCSHPVEPLTRTKVRRPSVLALFKHTSKLPLQKDSEEQ